MRRENISTIETKIIPQNHNEDKMNRLCFQRTKCHINKIKNISVKTQRTPYTLIRWNNFSLGRIGEPQSVQEHICYIARYRWTGVGERSAEMSGRNISDTQIKRYNFMNWVPIRIRS